MDDDIFEEIKEIASTLSELAENISHMDGIGFGDVVALRDLFEILGDTLDTHMATQVIRWQSKKHLN